MEKRAMIAVVLSIAFFYVYSTYLMPAPKAPKPNPAQGAVSSARMVPVPAPAGAPIPVAAAQEQEVTVDTPLYTAVFSTLGGALKSFTLKDYREAPAAGSPPVRLVHAASPAEYLFRSGGSGLPLVEDAVYAPSAGAVSVAAGEAKELVFTWQAPTGVQVRKVFRFSGAGYGISLVHQISNLGASPVAGNLRIGMQRAKSGVTTGRHEVEAALSYADGKLTNTALKDLEQKQDRKTNVGWAGFTDKYFLTALLAGQTPIAEVLTQGTGGTVQETVVSPQLTLQPGQQTVVSYDLFLGPKQVDLLKAQGKNLEQALDLGWFSALAMPLLQALKFLYRFVHNYGIAIIIITVVLKVLFYPLTYKSYKSMKEMQKVQPMMAKIREKYKNDRDAMNREVMKLYQEHKVNPLGGCLPMIVQIPVFFALYKALMFSIELRHAPFMLWITDLAGKDPYYVTPIIMGVTMVIQQRMTPSQMDPVQAKMMMALPVVFTFMFLNFPSGLVLYWLVNNILTIAQQAYINGKLKA
ncbi:MAG TPA: membrane protein insertase YidC [Verrucomicrobiae bacterium]|nr:membrane protein insertase YidC [Verrucomicrobiae bacterium]